MGFGMVFQLVSFRRTGVLPGPLTLVVCGVVVVLAVVILVGTGRAVWLSGWVLAVLLGLDFAGAVADRLGAFGPPGAVGVSWGGWEPFVDYTARLLPSGTSGALVTVAALAATTAEVTLGVVLVSGWQRRWAGKAAAGLLLVYLWSMGWALGSDAVALYGLPLQIGGALLMSSCPAGRLAGAARAELRRESRVRARSAT